MFARFIRIVARLQKQPSGVFDQPVQAGRCFPACRYFTKLPLGTFKMISTVKTQNFRLSMVLTERGIGLTEQESLILDAAQTLQKKFQHGAAVKLQTVRRVVMQFHRGAMDSPKFRIIVASMVTDGLCEIDGPELRLACQAKETKPSRLSRLTTDKMQQDFLQACHDCCGTGFRARNVSAVAAVQALISARFGIQKNDISKLSRALQNADILEVVPSNGSTAYRLTASAERTVNAKIEHRTPGEIPCFSVQFSEDAWTLFYVAFDNSCGGMIPTAELFRLACQQDANWNAQRMEAALTELQDREALTTQYDARRALHFCCFGCEAPPVVYADISEAVNLSTK